MFIVSKFVTFYLRFDELSSFHTFFLFLLRQFSDFVLHPQLFTWQFTWEHLVFHCCLYCSKIHRNNCNLHGFCDISSIVLKYLFHWYWNPHIQHLFLVYTMKLILNFVREPLQFVLGSFTYKDSVCTSKRFLKK